MVRTYRWSIGDPAPGWVMQCSHCGCEEKASRVGAMRKWASARGKRVLGFCRECQRPRLMRMYQHADWFKQLSREKRAVLSWWKSG